MKAFASKGLDRNWVSYTFPWHSKSVLKATAHWRRFVPLDGSADLNMGDFWFSLVDNGKITNDMLGIIIDIYPRMPENYRPGSQFQTTQLAQRGLRQLRGENPEHDGSTTSPVTYPTLSMTLEIKKLLPPEGVTYVFLRAQAKEIKNGRMDSEVVILNDNMELVAVSQQLSFVVSRVNREDPQKVSRESAGNL